MRCCIGLQAALARRRYGFMPPPPYTPDVVETGRASLRAGVGLHHLRYVLAAAEMRGFRRAARALGVQQSALSRRIQELEARLGAQIFERTPQGVRLTDAGDRFVCTAREAVIDLDLAVETAFDVGREQAETLRLGVLGGFGGGPLHEILRSLMTRAPGLRLDLIEGDAASLSANLLSGRLDLALLVRPPARLSVFPAWREHVFAAVPINDPLADRRTVTWADFSDRRLLTPAAIAAEIGALCRRRASDAPAPVSAGAGAAARLVALGQGCALINEGSVVPVTGVAYRPIARTFLDLKAVVGRRPEKPVLRPLLSLLTQAA